MVCVLGFDFSVFFGVISHGSELVLISLCVLWVDFSWVWVGFDFSVL